MAPPRHPPVTDQDTPGYAHLAASAHDWNWHFTSLFCAATTGSLWQRTKIACRNWL